MEYVFTPKIRENVLEMILNKMETFLLFSDEGTQKVRQDPNVPKYTKTIKDVFSNICNIYLQNSSTIHCPNNR